MVALSNRAGGMMIEFGENFEVGQQDSLLD